MYLAVGGIGALPSKEGSACSSRVEVGVLHLDLLLALDPLHSMTSSRLTLASSPLGHGQVLAHVTCGSPLGSADWWIEHQPQVQDQPPESVTSFPTFHHLLLFQRHPWSHDHTSSTSLSVIAIFAKISTITIESLDYSVFLIIRKILSSCWG